MNRVPSKRTWVVWLVAVAVLVQIASGAAEPNGVIPNDPLFPLQWHLHNTGQIDGKPGADINAVQAWEITTGDPNIIIAVIGEGIDLDHPDLVHNLVPGTDFFDRDDAPYPGPASGGLGETMAAGLIAAEGNNGTGVAGVAWHCKIMPVRVMNAIDEYWGSGISAANEAAAYRWAATHGASVISYGWLFPGSVPAVLRSALLDITKPGGIGRDGKGCIFVTSARSNRSEPGSIYLGAYPETISVDAVDPWDRLWGTHVAGSRVDLVAPVGQNPRFGDPAVATTIPMWTTDSKGPAGVSALDYTDAAGAVVWATPLVAGVAALILSVEPDLTNEEVRHYLCRSAHDLGTPGRDDEYGWGRVDARAALDMVLAARADLRPDGVVDEEDLAVLTAAMVTNDLSADIAPAAKRDGVVDAKDRKLLMRYLGTEIPEFGLLAHWKLDETEGAIAYGSATTNEGVTHLGELHGGPTWQPTGGRKAGALQLDGTDDYISTAQILDPSAGPFSVFAWVKGGAPGQVIVAQQGGVHWLMIDAAGQLTTELKPTRGGPLVSPAIITDGQWHRVGLTWNGSRRALYVDEVEVARDAKSLSGGLPGSTKGLYLGAGSTLTPGTFWSGLLDDVRLYNRAVKP
jgi:subtilisin family serine protease